MDGAGHKLQSQILASLESGSRQTQQVTFTQVPKIIAKLLLLVYLPAKGDGAELERKLTRSRTL